MRRLATFMAWFLLIGIMGVFVLDSLAQPYSSGYKVENKWWKNGISSFFYVAKRSAYALVGFSKSTQHKDLFQEYLPMFISMNPSPVNSSALSGAMAFFIHLLQPFYALGIIVAAFYLIFASASPGDRYRIKSILTKFLAGMIIISLSTAILQLFFSLSEGLTAVILGLTDVSVFLTVMDDLLSTLGWYFFFISLVDMSLGFYAMLPIMFMVWGIFGIGMTY